MPIIYDRSESGLHASSSTGMFGPLGEIQHVTVHHSAGQRAPTKAVCQRLNRIYQNEHIAKGWGDIGYHFCVDDLGRFYRLRSTQWKGAHVGGWNTGNVGVMFHGNYDIHELTAAQRLAIEWLFKGGFYVLTHEREAGIVNTPSHHEWPGHASNACPGRNLQRHWAWRRSVDLH